MQVAPGGLPVRKRRKYKNHEVGDYTLSELVKAVIM